MFNVNTLPNVGNIIITTYLRWAISLASTYTHLDGMSFIMILGRQLFQITEGTHLGPIMYIDRFDTKLP